MQGKSPGRRVNETFPGSGSENGSEICKAFQICFRFQYALNLISVLTNSLKSSLSSRTVNSATFSFANGDHNYTDLAFLNFIDQAIAQTTKFDFIADFRAGKL